MTCRMGSFSIRFRLLALLALFVVRVGWEPGQAAAEFQIATEAVSADESEADLLDDAGDDSEEDAFSDSLTEDLPAEVKKAPKPNFGPYRSGFERICKLIRADGRQEFFYAFLVDHAVPDEECVFCEKYFRVLASACKPKKPARGSKKPPAESAEPIIPAIPKQREPTAELMALTFTVYEQLAEDRKVDEIYQAVDALVTELLEVPSQSPGSRDYFRQLTSFMLLPFSEHREQIAKESLSASGSGDGVDVNALFPE